MNSVHKLFCRSMFSPISSHSDFGIKKRILDFNKIDFQKKTLWMKLIINTIFLFNKNYDADEFNPSLNISDESLDTFKSRPSLRSMNFI